MSERWLEDVKAGDALPPLVKNASRAQLFLFSAATHNPHRVHYDRDYAKLEGHDDILVHGPLQGAWLHQFVQDWAGPRGRVIALSFQNRGRAFPERDLVIGGRVTSVDGDVVALELEERDDTGALLIPGAARARLPRRRAMKSQVHEIARGVHRISTFAPEFGIQFNQFLVADDEPFLMHTGMRRMFEHTLAGVRQVIDPASLRWIGFSHFEPDECGALNEWLATANRAQAVCSFVGATVCLNDYADRPPRALADGEVLPIGSHRLRFLATPHVPHGWDAGLFFEETDRTLLCSDLFFQPGDPAPLTEEDITGVAALAIREGAKGPLANDMPYTPYTDATLRRLAALGPRTLAAMHGSSYRGDGSRAVLALARVIAEELGGVTRA